MNVVVCCVVVSCCVNVYRVLGYEMLLYVVLTVNIVTGYYHHLLFYDFVHMEQRNQEKSGKV